jgi:hypothetical protein
VAEAFDRLIVADPFWFIFPTSSGSVLFVRAVRVVASEAAQFGVCNESAAAATL